MNNQSDAVRAAYQLYSMRIREACDRVPIDPSQRLTVTVKEKHEPISGTLHHNGSNR